MKRRAALLALVLGTAALISAQDKSKGAGMTGMDKSACNASCKHEHSPPTVSQENIAILGI
jgi:hypothetical protein